MRLTRVTFLIALLAISAGFAWDSKIHSGIVHAALMAIPPEDRIQERWGPEVWRLQEYVQMGDWINMLVSQREAWDVGGQTLTQAGLQFYANDYLLFPSMSHSIQHSVPDVLATYQPFFLRALQALRTESPANGARWIGSLLHFITDSGSPPHTIGVKGEDHTKMESWLDTSLIDLSQYQPRMLGNTDEAALRGLLNRMDGLIAFSAVRGKQVVKPLVKVNDRPHMEPIALESAAETSRVAADLIHTLLRLSRPEAETRGARVAAAVSATAVDGMENLPAKLIVLGTSYSTLSVESLPAYHTYLGTFSLRNLPPGAYRMAIERVGSETLYPPPLVLKAGETVRPNWKLQPSQVAGNLSPNPDLSLRWVDDGAPDHWRFDRTKQQWISDNIPVTPGRNYRAGCELKQGAASEVELQMPDVACVGSDEGSCRTHPSFRTSARRNRHSRAGQRYFCEVRREVATGSFYRAAQLLSGAATSMNAPRHDHSVEAGALLTGGFQTPMSSYHSSGLAWMNFVIRAMHSSSCITST